MAENQFTTEELETEEWRPVVSFEGFYEVSSLGRVKRVKAEHATQVGRILKPRPHYRGYRTVNLYREPKKPVTRYIHILVATAFIGVCPDNHEVNHKDTEKANNRQSNLEYNTHPENMAHAQRNGLFQAGDGHYTRRDPEQGAKNARRLQEHLCKNRGRKLDIAKVAEIRTLLANGIGATEIASKYLVTKTVISAIKHGRLWKD